VPPTIYVPPTNKKEPDADNRAFIRGLYHSVLDRDLDSDSSTLAYWENILNRVKKNPPALGLPSGTDTIPPRDAGRLEFIGTSLTRGRELLPYLPRPRAGAPSSGPLPGGLSIAKRSTAKGQMELIDFAEGQHQQRGAEETIGGVA
jgi:hypothetical protein